MSDYDQQYYFLQKASDERLPSLTADEDTVNRNYTFERQPQGSAPLMFFNGSREYDRKMKIGILRDLPDILFNGTNLLVRPRIREALLNTDIPDLHIHPAIYIHDDEKWHEDYWFLTFTQRFDCWDRNTSSYEEEALEIGGFKLHSIYSYSLDPDLMARTPQEQRLLFKMGGSQDAFITCHQDLLKLFSSSSNSGLKAIRVADY